MPDPNGPQDSPAVSDIEDGQVVDAEMPDPEEADAIISEPVVWSAEVTDLLKLVKYCAANPEWVHLVAASMPNLNSVARSQRDGMNIPGVRAVSKTSRAPRA